MTASDARAAAGGLPDEIVQALTRSIRDTVRTRHLAATRLPNRETILGLLDELRALVFPGFFGKRDLTEANLADHVRAVTHELAVDLTQQIRASLAYMRQLDRESGGRVSAGVPTTLDDEACEREARRLAEAFMRRLPEVRRLLALDVQAALEGDPAAIHTDEIVFCYPGLQAVMIHRVAHELYRLKVPLLPRIMSEHAHSTTGIDIHPGATIGESFFVDHGTGVVIGETTIIGRRCKLYQGVTLGARSFPMDEQGNIVRGLKRHPTLGDRVVVYAGATILGGDTTIGDDCVIGGGVFLTRSVPPGCIVRTVRPELMQRPDPAAGASYEFDGSGI